MTTAGLVLLALLGTAGAADAPKTEQGLTPERQFFFNATEELVRDSIYHPNRQEVTVGAMTALRNRLGAKFAHYFAQPKFPNANEAMHEFSSTIDEIANDPAAVAAGWTTMKLFERALDGYCRTLDPYSNYVDEETARRSEEMRKLDYVGIGLTVQESKRGFLGFPFSAGPADRAGVRMGDELLEIDRALVRPLTLLEVSDRLSGTAGSRLQLKVAHKDGKQQTLTVTREKIASTPIALEQQGKGWRMSIGRLNPRTLEDCRQALQTIGPGRELTLDLRGSPGGDLEVAVQLAELFLPEKTAIVLQETVHGTETILSHNAAPYRPKRMILLQDEGTASGAELIIAALLAHAPLKAESRGTRTFGKGVALRVIRIPHAGYLKFADIILHGPRRESWNETGLEPTSDAAVDAP